jgi:3-oxoadipate enol-lactonase
MTLSFTGPEIFGKSPPVVLLYPPGKQSSDWTPVASALVPSWLVRAPDLRGHGASDWPG